MADVSKVIDNGVLTITVAGFAPFVIDPDNMPRDLVNHAALHGFAQKYGDAAALSKGSSLREKYEAIKTVVDHHADTGEWNRKGSGDGSTGDGLLVAAIMEFQTCDRETARGLVGQMDKKLQAQMRATPELKAIIDKIKLAKTPKAPAGFDASTVLAQLMKKA